MNTTHTPPGVPPSQTPLQQPPFYGGASSSSGPSAPSPYVSATSSLQTNIDEVSRQAHADRQALINRMHDDAQRQQRMIQQQINANLYIPTSIAGGFITGGGGAAPAPAPPGPVITQSFTGLARRRMLIDQGRAVRPPAPPTARSPQRARSDSQKQTKAKPAEPPPAAPTPAVASPIIPTPPTQTTQPVVPKPSTRARPSSTPIPPAVPKATIRPSTDLNSKHVKKPKASPPDPPVPAATPSAAQAVKDGVSSLIETKKEGRQQQRIYINKIRD